MFAYSHTHTQYKINTQKCINKRLSANLSLFFYKKNLLSPSVQSEYKQNHYNDEHRQKSWMFSFWPQPYSCEHFAESPYQYIRSDLRFQKWNYYVLKFIRLNNENKTGHVYVIICAYDDKRQIQKYEHTTIEWNENSEIAKKPNKFT